MKKILIVEDDSSIADVLKIILEGEGFSVILDGTGDEVIKQHIPSVDLALVDYLLPGKSGIDVITAIKTNDRLKGIPIILMSANTESELAEIAKSCEVETYLPKPFDVVNLIEKVKNLL